MEPIAQFLQPDLTQTYSYAGCPMWKLDEFVELVKGRVMRPMAGPNRSYQRYAIRLSAAIDQHIKKSIYEVFTAPFNVRLVRGGASGNQQIRPVVQPNICVVCDPAKPDDCGCVGAPD